MYKKHILKLGIIVSLIIIGIVTINYINSRKHDSEKKNVDTVNINKVRETIKSDILEIKKGKYSNLNIISLEYDMPAVEKIQQINMSMNMKYKDNTHKENFEIVKNTINNFFKDKFDLSEVKVYVIDSNKNETQNTYETTFEIFEKDVNSEMLDIDKYFTVFGDARENGGKGFVQIDSPLINTWFSKGEIEATVPMFAYNVKKVYNLTVSSESLEDVIKLKNGNISVKDAIKFVENYLNTNLPFEKNKAFSFEVAEVRVLDVDGQDALGFCVRKKYDGIPFDYGDGETQGEYNSEFYDDCGAVCMINTNEIDNMVGLGSATFLVEKKELQLDKIITIDKAFEKISENIGKNSVYNVYGAELVYQFKEEIDESESRKYIGELKWKITTRNTGDSKDTWFYVDVVDGSVTHRFKKIYGEQ